MSSRPSFQFYPGDWRNDPGLRLCSAGARGVWIDMLCLMHEGQPYGHLTVQGRPISAESLARLLGETATFLRKCLKELAENEVYDVNDEGVIFSRRMVRDEELRTHRAEIGKANGIKGKEFGRLGAEHGKKGGRPPNGNPPENPPRNGGSEPGQKPPKNPHPSSSSSSSSSSSKEKAPSQSSVINSIHPSSSTTSRDFDRVCEAAGWRPPSDAKRALALAELDGWMDGGFDLELDILPGVRRAVSEQPGKTGSLKRFTTTIAAVHAERLHVETSPDDKRAAMAKRADFFDGIGRPDDAREIRSTWGIEQRVQ